ncbi:MAG: PqqD family protein [Bacteroidales bacterium]|nr:PqqD family protein [Bacteroidales bacterium]
MKVKKGFELQNVCGEYLLIPTGIENVDFSNVININATTAYLWEKVAAMEQFDIDTLVELLMQEYEVSEDVAREDCTMIAQRMKEIGLIE